MLSPIYAVLLSCAADKASTDNSTTDTAADDTGTPAEVAVLVGDDVPAEDTAWAYGVFHLELTEASLTGTVAYREDRDSGTQHCAGTLALQGEPETTLACNGEPCTWGYQFTVASADITSGECAYLVPDMALNLADTNAVGILAYWEDSKFWGDPYEQLMILGYTSGHVWGGMHVLEDTAGSSFGLESYDAEAGTVDVDAGGAGRSVPLLYSAECDDISHPDSTIVTAASPLSGSVPDAWEDVADVWELSLDAGDTLQVMVEPDSDNDTLTVDLLSPSGCLQSDGDDWTACPDGGTCASLSHTASKGGTYQIAITGSWCSSSTCAYDLHIEVE